MTAFCENFRLQVAEDAGQEKIAAPDKPAVQEQRVLVQPSPLTPQQPEAVRPTSNNATLEKNESVSIQKSSKVVATLEWPNNRKSPELYCFYVLQTGETGKVYYRHLGSPSSAPYITLEGDSETVVIHQPSKLKYVLFAAYRGGQMATGAPRG